MAIFNIGAGVYLHTQDSIMGDQDGCDEGDQVQVDFCDAPYWITKSDGSVVAVCGANPNSLREQIKKIEISRTTTLRDQFAMAALTGMLVNQDGFDPATFAAGAYEIAAAMLAERSKIHGDQDY
jgi:hypothetical protein